MGETNGRSIATLDRAMVRAAKGFTAETIVESNVEHRSLPIGIKPIARNMRVCGPAFTVVCGAADNFWLHRAMYMAQPGDVLVVQTSDNIEAGYWGEIMTRVALLRRLDGLVIDGCVRDSKEVIRMKFPVFARGLCIQGTTKIRSQRGGLTRRIRIGKTVVAPGDLIVGDDDGIAVVRRGDVERTLANATTRQIREKQIISKLRSGVTTLQLLDI